MSRYSLRQTPRKKELFDGMVETPTASRRSSRRQSSFPPEFLSNSDNESSSATDASTRTRSLRRRTGKFTEDLEEEEDIKPAVNGKSVEEKEAASESSPRRMSTPKSIPKKQAAKSADAGVVDGWCEGQDPKVDYSGEFEFGGSCGTLSMMILFPVLMWYMWIGATYYDGKVPSRTPGQTWASFASQLVNYVYIGAFPHTKAWLWYWSYLTFQCACYCLLPGVWGWGKPLPHEGGKQLKYFCNAFVTLYFTLSILAVLHFTGIWPLYNAIDEFGPLLSVAILSGFLVSFVAYFSALHRGKQHRMTGYPIYDFFMGAELNPRMFGILDFKMFCEVRMPWYFLLILSLGTAARQWERYGYVSGEVMFLVMAHYLYANACAKGEELIITTWDMYYEKWGFMLIFWNLAGVPLSYCHCTIFLANHDPAEYHWNRWFLAAMYIGYLFWYWVWDSCNSQKNRFRAMERGKMIARNTFPQVPWQTIHNPKTIKTPQGTILVDGWYGLARKIHYTADAWFAISWGLITGFKSVLFRHFLSISQVIWMITNHYKHRSPFPWFYPVFFCCMIAHRAARDIYRCRNKYGEHWLEYERQVPYLFIPYVL
ncbi:C-24(28) sterol reductase [Conoideocrella luteorostrata]|uniref:Delta(24(24(1)))-sterol reductase n=1 Tax=Conoideocrella luteorostrata TaxID=1105319 RepID=A0AAJ0CZQ1_9HYPO|nr:C-24(28) sterol reductase [Conoideocrella luteorostrata]